MANFTPEQAKAILFEEAESMGIKYPIDLLRQELGENHEDILSDYHWSKRNHRPCHSLHTLLRKRLNLANIVAMVEQEEREEEKIGPYGGAFSSWGDFWRYKEGHNRF